MESSGFDLNTGRYSTPARFESERDRFRQSGLFDLDQEAVRSRLGFSSPDEEYLSLPRRNVTFHPTVQPKREEIDSLINRYPSDIFEHTRSGTNPFQPGYRRDITVSSQKVSQTSTVHSCPTMISTGIGQNKPDLHDQSTTCIDNDSVFGTPQTGMYSNPSFPRSDYPIFPSSSGGAISRKEINPPSFDGTENWKHFIFRFEQVAAYNRWDDATKRLRLTICLEKDAIEFCSTLRSVAFLTYQELKLALQNRFEEPDNENVYKSQFRSRIRREGEEINAFLHELQRLASKAFPKEQGDLYHQLICDQFVQGIRNRECKEFLQLELSKSKSRGHKLVQEILGLAHSFEAIRGQLDRPRKPNVDYDRPYDYARVLDYGNSPYHGRSDYARSRDYGQSNYPRSNDYGQNNYPRSHDYGQSNPPRSHDYSPSQYPRLHAYGQNNHPRSRDYGQNDHSRTQYYGRSDYSHSHGYDRDDYQRSQEHGRTHDYANRNDSYQSNTQTDDNKQTQMSTHDQAANVEFRGVRNNGRNDRSPPGYNFQGSRSHGEQHTNFRGRSKVICSYCGRSGHIASRCWDADQEN